MKYGLLDLDGVLVDFVTGACAAHNRPNPYDFNISKVQQNYYTWEILELDKKEFWSQCSHIDFWHRLKWMPDGKEILKLVEDKFGKENVFILSYPITPGSCAGKMMWIEDNLPDYIDRFFFGRGKFVFSSPNNILIDDHDENVEMYNGTSILVPRPWNKVFKKKALPTLEKSLKTL